LNDLSGNGTHAAFQNAPTFVSSPIKTFQWNTRGSNGSNTTKASFSNVLGDDMTVGAWIKTSNSGNDLAHYRLLYILTGEQGGGANDWGFGINRLGKLAFGAGTNDVTISSTTSVNTNEWTYVVATRAKSTGQIKLYINGALDASGTGYSGNTLNAQTIIAIADGDDGPSHSFGGNIAAVQGYDKVLSLNEISTNYSARNGSTILSSPITTAVTALSVSANIAGDGCVNRTALSTNTPFNSYAWFLNESEISNTNSQTYTPSAAGNYYARVFNGTCYGTTSNVTINTCGITATGRMSTSASLVNKLGGAANATNKGVDERGLIINVP
jgi:hypothetical protein